MDQSQGYDMGVTKIILSNINWHRLDYVTNAKKHICN